MKPGLYLSLAFLILAGVRSFAAYGEIYITDVNHDGNPDGWTYMKNGTVEKQEIDMNFDGKIDTVYLYELDGTVKEEILDTNYDGKMDNWRLYDAGELIMDRIDSNLDGNVDIWFYIDGGRIYRLEKDINGNGEPDVIKEY